MTARDDLEASLRRNLTETGVPARYHNAIVDHFLPAAGEYAAGDSPELAALRRAVLDRERADIGGDRRSPGWDTCEEEAPCA